MKEIAGKRWGDLQKELQVELLSNCNCIDGQTCNNKHSGECIVDLNENYSVCGRIVDGTILISKDSIIYNPSDGRC